ncbi:hypothetical protein LPH50_06390 [Xylella taiwanensis]|uniref:Uncharacterized protein n=1 Tax=Xylella taiwanensis TaxID=1444770 RepID=Z9JH37_9GAMM|nr:hypothetical protein [Xylella taiwanensis]EWS77338.1 hypothetical protein AF72_11260 [Xylella taiwanensis]QKD97609.1 hypothetical protein PLS229_00705 [Xylella taiwanensis]UFM92809.1 hypothetical protein LPH39_06405 [Xylella taiwanensis]UFN12738.1 hypothetical protein LPH61_06270 [Xylella taiwanensis]UFN15052.1 hypothetical protein LPH50_06390 [Xylella taiwanensis]
MEPLWIEKSGHKCFAQVCCLYWVSGYEVFVLSAITVETNAWPIAVQDAEP